MGLRDLPILGQMARDFTTAYEYAEQHAQWLQPRDIFPQTLALPRLGTLPRAAKCTGSTLTWKSNCDCHVSESRGGLQDSEIGARSQLRELSGFLRTVRGISSLPQLLGDSYRVGWKASVFSKQPFPLSFFHHESGLAGFCGQKKEPLSVLSLCKFLCLSRARLEPSES
jgi:hypothetical protein